MFKTFAPFAAACRQRRSTSLFIEPLEDRLTPSVTSSVSVAGGVKTVTITGDGASNTIGITSNGAGRITVTGLTSSSIPVLITSVDKVRLFAGNGDDKITSSQTGVGQTRNLGLLFDLGYGDDEFAGTMNGSIGTSSKAARLSLEVYGGIGWDELIMNAGEDFNKLDVNAGSRLDVTLKSGGDHSGDLALVGETVSANFVGRLRGALTITARGGELADVVSSKVRMTSGSNGGSFSGLIAGEDGSDQLLFTVRKDVASNSSTINATLDGGLSLWAIGAIFGIPEMDQGTHTTNVHCQGLELDVPIV